MAERAPGATHAGAEGGGLMAALMNPVDELAPGYAGDDGGWSDAGTPGLDSWADELAPSYARSRTAQTVTQGLESWAEETAPSYARAAPGNAATQELESWTEEPAPSYARDDVKRRSSKTRPKGRRRRVTATAAI